MGRSTQGQGMHRQFWVDIDCPYCGVLCKARRTLPGQQRYIKAHFNNNEELCPPSIMPVEIAS